MRLTVSGRTIQLVLSTYMPWIYVYLTRWQGNEHLLYAQDARTHQREQFLREIAVRLRGWEKGHYP